MRYEVVYVGDDDLPARQSWAFVQTRSEVYLFVKGSRASAELFTEAWRAWQGVTTSGQRHGLLQLQQLACATERAPQPL